MLDVAFLLSKSVADALKPLNAMKQQEKITFISS